VVAPEDVFSKPLEENELPAEDATNPAPRVMFNPVILIAVVDGA
jgi:hypothetical protein